MVLSFHPYFAASAQQGGCHVDLLRLEGGPVMKERQSIAALKNKT